MPELPEVETIKNDLSPQVVGYRLTGVALYSKELVKKPSPEEFCQRLPGQEITRLERRGKFLLLRLSGNNTLIVHLRMTGGLFLETAQAEPKPYTRAIFYLESGREVHLRDRRKLATAWLVTDAAEVVGKLGPEPLEPSFTWEVLQHLLRQHSTPVKALLCDQSIIAGIGNMYADEALFVSQIHPFKPARTLSQEETRRLHQAIQQVLRKGILYKGASVDTYLRPSGEPGKAQEEFMAAHRSGKPCHHCGTTIQRLPLRGRGTHFCPLCQKLG